MTSLQNSVLKISRHFIFVINFQKFQFLNCPGTTLVSFAKSYHSYPCKKYQRKSLFHPNLRRKPKSRSLLILKECQNAKHYESGLLKSNLIWWDIFFTYKSWKIIHFHHFSRQKSNLWSGGQKTRLKGRLTSLRVRATHTEGAWRIECVRHTGLHWPV